MMDKKKGPALAILVGNALSKAGMKGKSDSDEESYDSEEDADAHLQEIADDMLKAIEEKDSVALKELLREAFLCLEQEPHEEADHSEY